MRFLFALPVALAVTAGLYYLWFNQLLNGKCVGCVGNEPIAVAEAPQSWPKWAAPIWQVCHCEWLPRAVDTSNSYTRRDKASPTPPEPVACVDDCDLSNIEIPDDALRITTAIQSRGIVDNFAPAYPKACLAKGESGAVIVEHDITPEGAVANARIILSPDRCFNADVLRAVSKFRYQPATDESGRAVWRRGVRETFIFELEG